MTDNFLPPISGIYAIWLIQASGQPQRSRVYVGSSYNVFKRQRQHLSKLSRGAHPNVFLQNSWNKYQSSSFMFELLEETTNRELLLREQHWIDEFRNEFGHDFLFNLCLVAGSTLGTKQKPETIAKKVAAKKGKPSPLKGRKQSPETIAKRAALMKGSKLSIERRVKIAETLRGHKPSAESIAKSSSTRRAKTYGSVLPEGICYDKSYNKFRVAFGGKKYSRHKLLDDAVAAYQELLQTHE